MKNLNYSKVSDNPEVIKLLKERDKIEEKIKAIEPMALINYEYEVLGL